MNTPNKRVRFTGRGKYGLPRWLIHYLKSYHVLESSRERVLTRLVRMDRVIAGRNRSLSIGRQLYQDLLKQNPGDFEDSDFPD
jgi:hypothetical protein